VAHVANVAHVAHVAATWYGGAVWDVHDQGRHDEESQRARRGARGTKGCQHNEPHISLYTRVYNLDSQRSLREIHQGWPKSTHFQTQLSKR